MLKDRPYFRVMLVSCSIVGQAVDYESGPALRLRHDVPVGFNVG